MIARIATGIAIGIGTAAFLFYLPHLTETVAISSRKVQLVAEAIVATNAMTGLSNPAVTHISTPASVKAIYMTSWVAGAPALRDHVIDLLSTTEANAVVIDIKDSTGMISFHFPDGTFDDIGSTSDRISDIEGLIAQLHAKGIYVIGRIAVFEDPYFVKLHPEYAVKKDSDKTQLWADKNGTHWLDAGEQPVWQYVSTIGDESYKLGFDELNFDYIRFPSDGDMNDIYFPASDGKVKSDVIDSFFAYLDQHFHVEHIPISADIFGLTTEANDDLGIGQIFENAVAHFDYVCPMVYPSAYAPDWHGFQNPAEYPTQVITDAMASAAKRTVDAGKDPATVLRPWLQDFNLGATYTASMVRDEINADYGVGLKSWSLWDPSNVYTPGALEPKS